MLCTCLHAEVAKDRVCFEMKNLADSVPKLDDRIAGVILNQRHRLDASLAGHDSLTNPSRTLRVTGLQMCLQGSLA